MKSDLIKESFIEASGVFLYITLFVWCINNSQHWFGPMPAGSFAPVLFLLIFVISASITGSLVLLRPILLYIENRKKEAVQLFFSTLSFLILLALFVLITLIILR